MKDSAFLGVRLADGLKLETTALGRRSPRVELSVAAARSARLGFGNWELGARAWRQCEGGRGRRAGVGWGGGRACQGGGVSWAVLGRGGGGNVGRLMGGEVGLIFQHVKLLCCFFYFFLHIHAEYQ